MGARRKSRELALQALYLVDVAHMTPDAALTAIFRGERAEQKIKDFAKVLVEGAASHLADLDERIKRYAQNWEIGRMAALDRNLLRLGTYELLHEPSTPPSVVIDEAVEIAKAFSTSDSSKFVNGILDKMKDERYDPKYSDGQSGIHKGD